MPIWGRGWSLELPFQHPSLGQGWGVPRNLEMFPRPHHFFILNFFPRRKQLSRVSKCGEIGEGGQVASP